MPSSHGSQNEGLSQTDLVERTGVDRSTLADIVRRMLKKGLLQRRRTKDDARAYAVKLTEEGWRDPAHDRADGQARRRRILAALPGKQREQFVADLQTIVEALQQARPASDVAGHAAACSIGSLPPPGFRRTLAACL